MRVILLLLFLIIGIWYTCPVIPYTEYNTPVQQPSSPDLSVQLVQDSRDTIQNPYAPPLRYTEDAYRQMGYLKHHQRVPLFGKPAQLRRDKWYYYTIIDGIKLPLIVNKRKSSIAPGVDSLSSGDKVLVDHEEFIVHLYEIDIY